jgi:hypothetical protein
MKIIPIFTFIILVLSLQKTFSQPNEGRFFRIAFYNVENLFDTIDDPLTNDADFLPGARIAWTADRYEVKLDHLARVMQALSEPQAIAVMGLCEIENKFVLDELVKMPGIIPYRYQVIHRDSPDERGIDNAVLYDAGQFQPLAIQSIPVILPGLIADLTRDILYVKGISRKFKSDTLHIFVNHWPSRSEGKEISEPKRIRAAETLKAATDSLFNRNPLALIVVLGDLNDEPSDKSLVDGLKALAPVDMPAGNKLYNLMEPLYKEGKGTLWYKDWDMFDQVIISGNFWNKGRGLIFSGKEGKIFEPEWLLYKSSDGTSRPNRTAAKDYYGGYSDHLPVYIDLMMRK